MAESRTKNLACKIAVPMLDSADTTAYKTGETIADEGYYNDGGAWTSLPIVDTFTEIGTTGIYEIDLTAGEMNHDEIIIKMTSANTADNSVRFLTLPAPANLKQIENDTQSSIDLKDFSDAGYDPATNKVQGVVLVDTLTTYTSNTPQTGDNFARIGVAGAGLTNINLPNQTMDITGNITGNLSGSVGSVTGAVGSVTGAVGSVTGAVGSVTGNVGGNVTGTVASVVGNVAGNVSGSVGSVVGHTAQTGDTYALANGLTGFVAIDTVVDGLATTIGVAGAGLSDLGGMSTGMKAEVEAEANDALVANNLDHMMKVAVTGADVVDNSAIAKIVSKSATADWDSYTNTTDALEALADTSAPSASTIAGAVWDEALAGHVSAGSYGKSVADIETDATGIKAVTDAIPDAGALTSIAQDSTVAKEATVSALNNISTAQVNTEVDTALSDIGLDHLVSASVIGTDITDNSIIAKMVSKSATADWDSFNNTTDALEGLSDMIGATSPTKEEIATEIFTGSYTTELTVTVPKEPTLAEAVEWLTMLTRNKAVTDGENGFAEVYNDAGTKVSNAVITDLSNVGTRAKFADA